MDSLELLLLALAQKEGSGSGGGTAYNSDPEMDGVASPGSSTAYARGDHRHPSDTKKLNTDGVGNEVTVQRNASYDFQDIPTQRITLQTLVNILGGWYAEIASAIPHTVERIFVDDDGAVTQEIAPNKVYMFTGELTSLTLTLGTPIDDIANIYQVFFKNGLTPVTLTLPASVDIGNFVPEAEKISELNIQLVEIGNMKNYCLARGDNR